MQLCVTSQYVPSRLWLQLVFLNFVAGIIKVGRPYIKFLLHGLGAAQVYAAWQSGRHKFNPVVRISLQACRDLTWWCTLLAGPVQRPLHCVGDKVFLWHQKNPQRDELCKLAWEAGIVVVLTADASGGTGWGIVVGNTWLQGTWSETEVDRHINYKELKVYDIALQRLAQQLKGKLVLIKLDNTCAVH